MSEIECGNVYISSALSQSLSSSKLELSKTTLVVDEPLGWVFSNARKNFRDCIVLTDNCCPTYLMNVWELGPQNVLPLTPASDLIPLLKAPKFGSPSPKVRSTPLSPAERHTVRLIAEGYLNREIADRRHVTKGVVRNSINAIHQKLNLYPRVHIAHYYYGQWHLLGDWERPPFLQG